MEITINGSNYYGQMKEQSLSITRSNDTKNSFSCILIGHHTLIVEGHEVIVTDGAHIIFGGIIQTVEIYDAGFGSWRTAITATGYEQIMSRRTGSGAIENKSCGQYIADVIDGYLSASSEHSEGIQKGLIYAGATITNKDLGVNSFKNIFDQLAEASGYRWWIDDDKKFYFSTHTELSAAPFSISESSDAVEVRNPKLSSSLKNYVNRLFVVGASGDEGTIVGIADDIDEISRMGVLDGYSGVFGKVVRNSDITDGDQAALTASNLLKNYDKRNMTFRFKTKQSGFDVNQFFDLTYPSMGIVSTLQFAIIKVSITDQGEDLIYSITSELYISESYPSDEVVTGSPSGSAYKMKPSTTWTDEMKKLAEPVEPSSGGGSIVTTAVEDRTPMTYYDGSTISLALTTEFQNIVLLAYTMNYADHVFYDLNFNFEATGADILTVQISDDWGVIRTVTKTIAVGEMDFIDLTSVMPARQIIDKLFKVEVKSANGLITVSNVVGDVHGLGMVNIEPYVPDPTRPFEVIQISEVFGETSATNDITGNIVDDVNPMVITLTVGVAQEVIDLLTMFATSADIDITAGITGDSINETFS